MFRKQTDLLSPLSYTKVWGIKLFHQKLFNQKKESVLFGLFNKS